MGIKGQKAWNKIPVNADRLRELYINQRKTAKEIAVILRISRDVVYRRLEEIGAPRRNNAEAHKRHRPLSALLAGSVAAADENVRLKAELLRLQKSHGLLCEKLAIYRRELESYKMAYKEALEKTRQSIGP